VTQASTLLPFGGRKQWRLRPLLPSTVRASLKSYHPLLAQLLHNRGISNQKLASAFLSQSPLSHDPFALPGMEAAVRRLQEALQRRETIAIFGDFDVDGLSATALLATALRPLGCEVIPYIPHRMEEGHGLSPQSVERLASQGVRLLVTVDTGISSAGEVALAAQAGVDTIITDHHLPPEVLPPALAIVDPRLPESAYPFAELTGAGLALKVAQALHSVTQPQEDVTGALLSLASLGTIADVAPLVDENRSIVRQGLDHLTRSPSPGLEALVRWARLEGRTIDTEAVGWQLAPRLNASGRMDSAEASYRLLTTQSRLEAETLAQTLEQQNRQRQETTEAAYQRAKSILELGPLLMVGDAEFSPGIIGLVAGRLAEEFARPAVVLNLGEPYSRGSCRSVPWFNIGEALHQVERQVGGFVRYGGHAQAAGFTIATERLPLLRQSLGELAKTAADQAFGVGQKDQAPSPWLDIDMQLSLAAMPKDVYRQVHLLSPFGAGNPEPVFLSRGVQVVEARPIGVNGRHLRLRVRDGGVTWNAVAFGQGNAFPQGATRLDIVYTVELDRFLPGQALQLHVQDMRGAG